MEVIQAHPRTRGQGAAQLEAFAIVTTKTDWINGPDTQRAKVIENRPGGAGLGADADDIVDREARFVRGFLLARIDFQVAVEAEIAYQRDA